NGSRNRTSPPTGPSWSGWFRRNSGPACSTASTRFCRSAPAGDSLLPGSPPTTSTSGRSPSWAPANPHIPMRCFHMPPPGSSSASHNPPDDNGGKFYDGRGGQPVPPDDQIMADLVDQVTHIKALPWAEAARSGRVHFLDEVPHRAYIDLCRKQSLAAPPRRDED